MWALIPLKEMVSAKGRLSPVLSSENRASLMSAMLLDVLTALKESNVIEKIFIVSKEPKCTYLEDAFNLTCLRFPGDVNLNAGVGLARQYLERKGVNELLVMHGDLPLVKGNDIDSLSIEHRSSGRAVTLVPSQKRDGTNAIVLTHPNKFPIRFGQDSFRLHKRHALKCGVPYSVNYNHNISIDIDDVSQLEDLPGQYAENDQRYTAAYIRTLSQHHFFAGHDAFHQKICN